MKKNDNPTMRDLANAMTSSGKFHALIGSNADDELKDYLGPDISSHSSALVHSEEVFYRTVSPYNGKDAPNHSISPELLRVVAEVLGRKLQDSDFEKLDDDAIQDAHGKEVTAMLLLLSKERLIIPGVHSGGRVVFLLISLGVTLHQVRQAIAACRTSLP